MVPQPSAFLPKPLLKQAANSARTLNTSDEEMEMMRFVIAHEVGHALGFP
jgi:hypothetical protein